MGYKKLAVETIGCRLNQYETEKMAADLYPFGFRRTAAGEVADLCIINTCTVTHRADHSSRSMISRAAREHPGARIVVAGCYADNDPDMIAGMGTVDVVIGNNDKQNIREILPRELPQLFRDQPDNNCSPAIADFADHNRAWLKISDGCNQHCSFCILPEVRGRLRNRPPGEIIDEINGLVGKGFCEVVLTGVNIGHYRSQKTEPPVKNLAALCRMIVEETELRKLRISSIEPQTVSREFLQMFAESADRVCRHLHLPLQSGSTRILRLMRRPYDRQKYIARLNAAKEVAPETVIGADVIVGFPGETDQDFEETRSLCQSGMIDYLHVFSYSDRPGTFSSQLADKIEPQVIKERSALLSQLSRELREQAHRRQIGRILEVIAEKRPSGSGYHLGVADNYLRVRLPNQCNSGKNIIKVKVTVAHDQYVEGELQSF